MRTVSMASFGRACRIAAWCCLPILVALSWMPAASEVRTGLPGQIEHVAAYAGTGLLAGLGTRRGMVPWIVGGLVLLAGVLEVGQLWAPGRNAQVLDFLASSAGAAAGTALGAGLRRGSLPRRVASDSI